MPHTAPFHNLRTSNALLLAAGMAATVGAALAFEHWGGFLPCKLCLEQRTPYYIGAPLMALAFLLSWFKAPSLLVRLLLAAGGLLMLFGLGLAIYHAGAEWKWWPGPDDCGAAMAGRDFGGGNLLDQLNSFTPPSCSEAAGRFLGLSFAGWNILASALWAVIALRAAWRR